MKNATYFAAHLQHCQRTPVKHGKVDHPKHLPASPWQSDNPSPTRRLNASLTSFPDPRPMSNYRRPRLSGRPIYFTTALAQRGSDLLLREIDLLRHAVRTTRADRPFHINAWVVLPDHMHCVWTLPEGDTDYSTRMGAIKARFSMALRRSGFTPTLPNPNPYGAQPGRDRSPTAKRVGVNPDLQKNEAPIWQKRFWEHHVRDDDDLAAHVQYCWHNPVKHGLVDHPMHWAYSSWHRDNPWGGVLPRPTAR